MIYSVTGQIITTKLPSNSVYIYYIVLKVINKNGLCENSQYKSNKPLPGTTSDKKNFPTAEQAELWQQWPLSIGLKTIYLHSIFLKMNYKI